MTHMLCVRKGFDGHCHLRQGPLLKSVVKYTATQFSMAVAMGNTVPAIATADDAKRYEKDILSAVPPGASFKPVMTIMLTRATTPEIVIEAGARGVKALKYIPEGVSTNSSESVGLNELPQFYCLLDAAKSCGMILSGHWEALQDSHGKVLPEIDREEAAIPTLDLVVKTFPGLKIVAEHATTKSMVDYIRQCPDNVKATLTLHHQKLTYHDVCDVDGKICNPFNYCKPIAKRLRDVEAVAKATISGDRHFFRGSDSAPHPRSAKERTFPAAGIFSAPVAQACQVQFFEENNALGKLDAFCTTIGPEFYGLPQCSETIELVKKDWIVPEEYDGIVPFMAGKTLHWQVAE